jgi:hypothetical protein
MVIKVWCPNCNQPTGEFNTVDGVLECNWKPPNIINGHRFQFGRLLQYLKRRK